MISQSEHVRAETDALPELITTTNDLLANAMLGTTPLICTGSHSRKAKPTNSEVGWRGLVLYQLRCSCISSTAALLASGGRSCILEENYAQATKRINPQQNGFRRCASLKQSHLITDERVATIVSQRIVPDAGRADSKFAMDWFDSSEPQEKEAAVHVDATGKDCTKFKRKKEIKQQWKFRKAA
jgi:hypothetical protein